MRPLFFILILYFYEGPALAQSDSGSTAGIEKGRLIFTGATHSALWAGSFIALNQAWYNDFNRSSFHTFNDNAEWNQVDKFGHIWSTYGLSRVSAAAWRWSGLKRSTASVMGAASGILYESIIELHDAFSDAWGFSFGDMGANFLGAGLFLFQDLHWQEQRIQIKMSYWPVKYDPALLGRRNQLFGSSFPEQFLKDYNAQTYWVSLNIASLVKGTNLLRWINVSFGYGAANMLGARGNTWSDAEGGIYNYTGYPRLRQFYLSPDVDLTKISSRKKWVRSLLSVLNAVKIPAPAIELNSKGVWSFHVIKF